MIGIDGCLLIYGGYGYGYGSDEHGIYGVVFLYHEGLDLHVFGGHESLFLELS